MLSAPRERDHGGAGEESNEIEGKRWHDFMPLGDRTWAGLSQN
jgi:hypothetical protein